MAQPSQLNINSNTVAYSDSGQTNNPQLRHFDWTRNLNGLVVYSPKAEQHLVPARTMLSLFDGLRTTAFDGTTSIVVSNLVDTTYRFKFSAGTDPVFATDIPISFTGAILTISVLSNQTITIAANSAVFTGVTGGSTFYIYSPTDNPSAALSILNSGAWVVMSNVANTTLTLSRPAGTAFQATAEVVTCNSANNVIAYTLSSVQVGDKMRITTPFSTASHGTHTVSAITSKWVDIVSTVPLVSETVSPSTTGMLFYAGGKRYLRIETDQRATVYFNGSTSQSQEIEPWQAGDRKLMGWQERIGPVWSLEVFNLASVPMTCNVFSAE